LSARGLYSLTSAITPKSGDIFVGEYGAILDGTGWSTTDTTQGAFRAHNEDINNVTIRNLVIRNMPQRGIHAFYQFSDAWTIEYNEIAGNQLGVAVPNKLDDQEQLHPSQRGRRIQRVAYLQHRVRWQRNRVQRTWPEVLYSTNVTFRNNFVHHNTDGIHFDSDKLTALIEGTASRTTAGTGFSSSSACRDHPQQHRHAQW
jgi:hypothetical protein